MTCQRFENYFGFFSEFWDFFFDLRGGACCLLVPWRQPLNSLVSIHFPEV